MRRTLASLFVLCLCLAFGGCATQEPPGQAIRLGHRVEFDGPDGADLLKLDPRATGVTLRDGSGATLARFRIEDGRLRIREAVGKPVGFVEPRHDGSRGLRIVEAPGSGILYLLRSEPDGDLRLEDGRETTLYELKRRDYGLKVVDGSGELQSKIRVKEGKISIRDAAGKTILSTRDAIPPVAVACLALRSLPLSYRAGLALAILHWGSEAL